MSNEKDKHDIYLQPSFFQCFLCKTRSEFDELCKRLKDEIIGTGSQPLFEITETSQAPWRCNSSSSPLTRTLHSSGLKTYSNGKKNILLCAIICRNNLIVYSAEMKTVLFVIK